ncbi:MAG: hypothetical protein JWP84_1103 [Tardiphaga sp.]|nr:hypothetical protein [Tardiphaga sp.]
MDAKTLAIAALFAFSGPIKRVKKKDKLAE